MRFMLNNVILCVVIATSSTVACSEQSEEPSDYLASGQVKVDEHDMDMIDHYIEIDQRALVGVSQTLANRALAGDGATAVEIGRAFARANHITESRFWYRIAAENGNGIGMNNYAVALTESDCRRSIYWFKKAAVSKDLSGHTKTIIERTLNEMTPNCR